MPSQPRSFVLYFNSDEDDKEILRQVRYALGKVWQFLRYSRKTYISFIHAVMVGVSEEERQQALETLRMFPDDKRLISDLRIENTDSVQPIPNQNLSSHYWKSDYFRKAILTESSNKIDVEYSGQDYLFAYWMGRFYGLISEEEATIPLIGDAP